MSLRYFLAVCLSLCISFANAQSASNVVDEVVWIVGDEAILKSDVENARLEALSQGQRLEGDPYCVIPENLAIQKLFLHQAAIDSVKVSDSEVFQRVDQRVNYYIQQLNGKEKMEEYFGKTTSQIREKLYDIVRDEMMTSEVRSSLVKDVKVTPAQVRRYFKDLPEDSLPFIPTKVECQIIVRNPVIEQAEIERIKAELRDYTERVNSGRAQFSTLAVMYSEDTGTARQGGECGFAGRGSFVPEFSNVAFSLNDPKAVSKIVETEYGFHIIQLIEKRGEQINVRHILRKPRVSDAAFTQAINDLDSIADEIRRGLYTFDECTQFVSHDKDTRNNYGNMFNAEDNSAKFEIKDLPVEVAKVVSSMNIGEISKPFIMVNNKGKEVVAIVKLKNKINGHRADMADDYQAMQDVVVAKQSVEKIQKWIREKQQTTYIHINDEWRNCEFQYPGWIK
jgi:peptidyl-prolyl cis-trans isomerase SurA